GLDAEGAGGLRGVVRRGFTGSVATRAIPAWLLAFTLALGAIVGLAARRRQLLAGLPRSLAAGLVGAWFATVVGAIANDSGPLILIIGAISLLLTTGYARSRPRAVTRP